MFKELPFNAMNLSKLKFDQAPLVETVLGVEFDAIPMWDIPHYGLYWEKIRQDYKMSSITSPLPSKIETFSKQQQNTITFPLLQNPEVRCWYFNEPGAWLVQLQKDQFICNWRKGSMEYPHYEGVRDRFAYEWQRFVSFLAKEGFPVPQIKQCEVTYINHIELDSDWDYSKLKEVFSVWSGDSGSDSLSTPEFVNFNLGYRLPHNQGRLRVSMKSGFRHFDARDIIQLDLTSREFPVSSKIEDLLKCFDLGHEWVLTAFTELTTPVMQNTWQKIERE